MSITDLYNNHKEWLRIASYNLYSKRYAEDVVQDMYMQIHSTNKVNINKGYVYTVLKFIAKDHYNNDKFSLEKSIDFDLILKLTNNDVLDNPIDVLEEVNNWEEKYIEVFKLKMQGKSIRIIANELNTSKDVIWTIYKKCKQKLLKRYGKEKIH